MKKNYITMFLLLNASSIMAGFALQTVVNSALLIGASLGTIFLFYAIVLVGKREKQTKAQ